MEIQRLRALSPRQRALVALAVLLEGRDASTYLENDALDGGTLSRSAQALSEQDLELRMALAATILRDCSKGERGDGGKER